MSYSFEYIDIILLAMIAGFIFLRLRGILGKKSGYEDEMASSFPHDFSKEPLKKNPKNMEFDDEAKNNFISRFQNKKITNDIPLIELQTTGKLRIIDLIINNLKSDIFITLENGGVVHLLLFKLSLVFFGILIKFF